MIAIQLENWILHNYANNVKLYIKGWVEYEKKVYCAHERFPFCEESDLNFSLLKSMIAKFCGEFAIVATCGDKVLIASDIVRSIPVFYCIDKDSISISSDVWSLASDKKEINENSIDEFISSGYVWGDKTFYKDIHGIEAGEILEFDGSLKKERYFQYISSPEEGSFPDGDTIKKLDTLFLNAIKK